MLVDMLLHATQELIFPLQHCIQLVYLLPGESPTLRLSIGHSGNTIRFRL